MQLWVRWDLRSQPLVLCNHGKVQHGPSYVRMPTEVNFQTLHILMRWNLHLSYFFFSLLLCKENTHMRHKVPIQTTYIALIISGIAYIYNIPCPTFTCDHCFYKWVEVVSLISSTLENLRYESLIVCISTAASPFIIRSLGCCFEQDMASLKKDARQSLILLIVMVSFDCTWSQIFGSASYIHHQSLQSQSIPHTPQNVQQQLLLEFICTIANYRETTHFYH